MEWTGLYFGANAGYGWGRYSSNITFTGLTVVNAADLTAAGGPTELSGTRVKGSGSPSGAIAGGQIGFNWQAGMAQPNLRPFHRRWVLPHGRVLGGGITV